MTKRIAVLVSGSGTLAQAVFDADVPVALVLADKPCRALERAHQANVPTMLIDRREYGYHKGAGDNWDRRGFTAHLTRTLLDQDIDVVAMMGFFTILHPVIFETYAGRILNSHPALLPKFPGEFAVRDTLAAGAHETGTTIHIATPTLDDSTYILEQRAGIPVYADDTVDSLWERIKVEERLLWVSVLRSILSEKLKLGA